MELVLGGDAISLGRGDTYFVPAGAPHSATIRAGYKDLTLFDQKDRYSVAR